MIASKIKRFVINSKILEGNLLADSPSRTVDVYLPPEFNSEQHYPLLVGLAGYTSSGLSWTNWRPFGDNLPQRLDRLISERKINPAVVAFPDCFTALGGNQYVNSRAIGNYADFLMQEVVPSLERTYSNVGGYQHRGCFGHSSGGYGALIHGMKYADFWSGVACHSGDIGFELAYLSFMPQTLTTLSRYDYSTAKFMDHFRRQNKPSNEDIQCLMMMGMCATYDPDVSEYMGVRFPLDFKLGTIIPERWRNWTKHDPLNVLDGSTENLRKLRALYIDCGSYDEYNLQYGARMLRNVLEKYNIPHLYEEFPDGHNGVQYRFDKSIRYLINRLE